MNIFKKIKIARFLMRVMTLQSQAPEGTSYNFEYSGNTNEVDFVKFLKVNGKYITNKRFHCYLEEDYGLTFKEFEKQIAIEEEVCKNVKFFY